MWKAIAVLLLLAPPVAARPWPRGVGHHFTTVDLSYDTGTGTIRQGLYHERGLGPRLTFVLSQGSSTQAPPKLILSLSRTLQEWNGLRPAWSIGLGTVNRQTTASAGVSLGRAVTLWGRSGWALADMTIEVSAISAEAKIDVTLGTTLDNGTKVYAQLFARQDVTALATGAAPLPPPTLRTGLSAAIPLADHLFLDIGATTRLRAPDGLRLRAGLWLDF